MSARGIWIVALTMTLIITSQAHAANSIVTENQQPGTTSWQFDNFDHADKHEIEGYTSAPSVNKGGSIDLMVSVATAVPYTMDVYRMGYYPTGTNPNGSSCAPACGGRLMQHIGPLQGIVQPTCPQNLTSTSPDFGLTECQWPSSYTLASRRRGRRGCTWSSCAARTQRTRRTT